MLNKVIIIGRLTRDPEFRQTTSAIPVCRFTVAVDRPYRKDQEKKADFINVTAWRNTAEFIARYFSKGKMIIVEGSLHNNDYTDNNGVKHYSMDVQAENVSFGESKGNSDNQQQSAPNFDTVPQYGQKNGLPDGLSVDDVDDFEEIISDGETPF